MVISLVDISVLVTYLFNMEIEYQLFKLKRGCIRRISAEWAIVQLPMLDKNSLYYMVTSIGFAYTIACMGKLRITKLKD